MAAQQREWTIGQLARVAGVSVRTLRHYDHLGLLVPSERSEGGHRRYGIGEVERLYRIVALRSLGVGLDAIAAVLDNDQPAALLDTVRRQLEHVDRELEAGRRLRERLIRMIAVLERAERPSSGDLIDLLEGLTLTVNLTRIYTKRGDGGETHLGDLSRVAKTHPRIEAYGAVDELNAHLGVALATGEVPARAAEWLRRIQNELFDVGADLAVPPGNGTTSRLRVTGDYVAWLERACDEANAALEPLPSFVIPAGTSLATQLHVCRTVCRRAERRILGVEGANPEIIRYVNRLSDLLFILSRAVNRGEEPLWQPGQRG